MGSSGAVDAGDAMGPAARIGSDLISDKDREGIEAVSQSQGMPQLFSSMRVMPPNDRKPVSDERIPFLLCPPEQCKSTQTTNAHAAIGQLSRAPT